MSNFRNLVRHYAEIKFGKENEPAISYIKWKNPSFLQEYKTYGEIHLLTPWKIKKLLREAGLKMVHDFPWGMDLEDYPLRKRARQRFLRALGLSWIVKRGFW